MTPMCRICERQPSSILRNLTAAADLLLSRDLSTHHSFQKRMLPLSPAVHNTLPRNRQARSQPCLQSMTHIQIPSGIVQTLTVPSLPPDTTAREANSTSQHSFGATRRHSIICVCPTIKPALFPDAVDQHVISLPREHAMYEKPVLS